MNKYERSNSNGQISILGQKNLQENQCTRFNVIENVPNWALCLGTCCICCIMQRRLVRDIYVV